MWRRLVSEVMALRNGLLVGLETLRRHLKMTAQQWVQLRRFRGRMVLSGCCTVRWSARACCIFLVMSRCNDCDCATTWSIRAMSLAVSSFRVSSGILCF